MKTPLHGWFFLFVGSVFLCFVGLVVVVLLACFIPLYLAKYRVISYAMGLLGSIVIIASAMFRPSLLFFVLGGMGIVIYLFDKPLRRFIGATCETRCIAGSHNYC